MKDELNNYNINNPDGSGKESFEGKQSYNNDNPGFIKENSLSGQKEDFRPKERFDDPKKEKTSFKSERNGNSFSDSSDFSSNASSSSGGVSASSGASVSSAASSVTSVASTLGGSIGALAGVVASAVVAAVIIVAVFVSTLTINATLVMADMTSLIFKVELTGAQDEDFAEDNPIIAVLKGNGTEVRYEMMISKDTDYLIFEDLNPGQRYDLIIRNNDKTFFDKYYFTTKTPVERGELGVEIEENEVTIFVRGVKLSNKQFYTVTVKDENGNVVFVKDSTNPEDVFTFTVSKSTTLTYLLSLDGKTYDFEQTELHIHEYGELIAEDYNGNGLVAHYECSGCHKLFDEDYIETTEEALLIKYVAKVTLDGTDTKYKSFADALDAWVDNSVLTLLDDVTITEKIIKEGGNRDIDLYGRTITLNSAANEQRIIQISGTGAVLNIYDSSGSNNGKLTGVNPGASDNGWSGAIYINSGAIVNMYGGTITGNTSTNGAGIWIDGRGHRGQAEFNMYGGVITGNTATNGGGVYVGCQLNEYATTAYCNIYGGTITGNTATYGGDVYVDKGVLSVSGSVEMGEVYLLDGKKIAITGELTNETPIGIIMQTAGVFTEGWSEYMGEANPADYFASRSSENSFEVGIVDGEVTLTEPRGVALSLNDGFIGIDPTGYGRSHSDSTLTNKIDYVSSESDPYIISGTINADDSLDVYNMTGTKQTIYLCFNEVYIQSGSWATAFRIIANADLDIYIVNEGSTTINAGNHYGIEAQNKADINVNIYVTGSESFSLSGDNGPFGAADRGTCSLYINGVKQ